jgi:hypothetical protein
METSDSRGFFENFSFRNERKFEKDLPLLPQLLIYCRVHVVRFHQSDQRRSNEAGKINHLVAGQLSGPSNVLLLC